MNDRAYLLCLSGFHRLLAGSIAQTLPRGSAAILNFDRTTKTNDKLRNLFRLALVRHSGRQERPATLFIPHIYNAWFATAASFFTNIAFYDDGIAYYYAAAIPRRKRVRVYSVLTRKHNQAFRGKAYADGSYYEYLRASNAVGYYSIFPELVGDIGTKVHHVNITPACPASTRKNIIAVLHSDMMSADVIREIERIVEEMCRRRPNCKVYAKMHPRHPDDRFSLSMLKMNAEVITGDWEVFLKNNKVSHVICTWSSGALSAKLLQPDCSITNIYSGESDANLVRLFEVIQARNLPL